MTARRFPFQILTPDRSFPVQDVLALTAEGRDGRFAVLRGHVPAVFELVSGVLEARVAGNRVDRYACGAGLLVVERSRTIVLAQSAEPSAQIDVPRAAAAQERAREALRRASSAAERRRMEPALRRAEARLRTAARGASPG